jgi:GDPmannose 4,6-dehydratase
MSKRKALVTGVSGQDGSYLAELLLSKGYEVYGVVRKEALEDPVNRLARLRGIIDDIELVAVSLESHASLFRVMEDIRPDECYHLAAKSFVSYSLDDEVESIASNVESTHYLLSAINQLAPECRFYFAGSSEMFGEAQESPQTETTRFWPRSPYGVSKVAGYHLARNYRERGGLFVACGLLYNHESPRRGFQYVTRKITSSVARIKHGRQHALALGNLDAIRDWGHARDYVEAMWLMLQQSNPTDYVVATGVPHTVRQFVEAAFECAGLSYEDYVKVDERFFRPAEKLPLVGNAGKARAELGWEARTSFEELIEEMVACDLKHPM